MVWLCGWVTSQRPLLLTRAVCIKKWAVTKFCSKIDTLIASRNCHILGLGNFRQSLMCLAVCFRLTRMCDFTKILRRDYFFRVVPIGLTKSPQNNPFQTSFLIKHEHER